ncbi:polysaccharide biosynthesis/export family protein [Rubellimicrobium aerolatum]|uniref:Polysaccharide biosynthesis/export family protein n=1 Tax=Rubellimicrobium aerolatum TaxID=490979 RepID=A0ABW0SE92_9RHOB|nr:polysaccharide biosynthesis/export family protein [Rubellimicrobium aerolatum]MBP1806802.1 polysaccharide export outer membrane protein [Rubellimicrobium aerolatum]
MLLAVGTAARAAATIQPGDVLRVSVLEDAQLGREAPVGVDGTIMLPRIGEVAVAGEGLTEVRVKVEDALKAQGIIRAPTVLVEFATYRPLYVGGAVARPGAIPFEPGLTVRHAIILAGGLDIGAGALPVTAADLDDLRARMRFGSYQLLQVDGQIARLRAELGPGTEADPVEPGLVPPAEAETLLSLDMDLLSSRLAEREANRAHLRTALELVASEIDILERQADLQEDERRIQQEELETARSLVERGVMPRSQLQELQREASQLSRDLLENQAFAARARQARADTEHELAAAEMERTITLREELRAALLERARITSEIGAMRDRLLVLGVTLDGEARRERATPEAVIHRVGPEGSEEIRADMETAILPGDVLDVGLTRTPEG